MLTNTPENELSRTLLCVLGSCCSFGVNGLSGWAQLINANSNLIQTLQRVKGPVWWTGTAPQGPR